MRGARPLSPLGHRAASPHTSQSLSAALHSCMGLGHPLSSPTRQPRDHLLWGHSALVPRSGRSILRPLATPAELTLPCSGTYDSQYLLPGSDPVTVWIVAPPRDPEFHISSILSSHRPGCLSERVEGRLWCHGDVEGVARGFCRSFWIKDTLDLKEMLKKDPWVKEQCRQGRDAEENVGAGGRAARIHPPFSPAVVRAGRS